MKEEEKPPGTDADKMLGVAEFEEQYFCGPLYLSDEDRTLYQHLGNLGPDRYLSSFDFTSLGAEAAVHLR